MKLMLIVRRSLLAALLPMVSACSVGPSQSLPNSGPEKAGNPPPPSEASGGVDGGGGKGVICRNPAGEITSVEMLDLFEAGAMYGQTVVKSDDDMDVQIRAQLAKIPDQPGKLIEMYSKSVLKNMKLTPPATAIVPVDDSFEAVVPTNCAVEQLAHYYTDSLIMVNGDFWEKMGPTDRAALILHEAVYAANRLTGAKNSRQSRHVVGSLFSNSTNWQHWRDGAPKDVLNCVSAGTSSFIAFEEAPGRWHLKFQILGGTWIVSQMTAGFLDGFDFNEAKSFPISSGEDLIGSGTSTYTSLRSNFDNGDVLTVRKTWEAITDSQGKKMRGYQTPRYYLSWMSVNYPKASFENALINCGIVYP